MRSVPLVPALALGALAVFSWWFAAADRARRPSREEPPLPATTAGVLAEGEALVAARGCEFCHETAPSRTAGDPRANCQDCHRELGLTAFLAPPLERIAERRPGEWIRRYLRHPYPIRENQPGRMPDLLLTDREVELLARYLEALAGPRLAGIEPDGLDREDDPDPARLARGRRLWKTWDCGSCHALGRDRPLDSISAAARFAPDLTRVAGRVRPGWLTRAIHRPSRWLPGTAMPESRTMTLDEARDLAWYVQNAVAPPPATVSYAEVQRIFDRRCLACHYGPLEDAPASANPAGGAGWLATWSRRPRRLDLRSYEGLAAGSLDDLGRPRPVVVPYEANSPLLAHLSGRKAPAMPFGLDPLPEDEYRTIERWILSGARGPREQGGVLVHPPIEVR